MRIHGAMLEIAGEHGYEVVTVRKLAQLAGVSTRAYYEQFDGKEDCFLRTYELVARGLVRQLIASGASAVDWRDRVRLTIGSFLREMERDPQAARFILVEAHGAGPAALDLVRRTKRTFEERIAADFARASDGVEVAPLLVRGIVAGVLSVARSRVLFGAYKELFGLTGLLASWAVSYRHEATAWLGDLDPQDVPRDSPGEPSSSQSNGTARKDRRAPEPSGDRALLLAAAQKLAVSQGYAGLTARTIRDAAGVPLRSFVANFAGVDDCFTAALGTRVREVLERADRAQPAQSDWAGGAYQAIASLCAEIARDPIFASLYCDVVMAAGATGVECRARLIAEVGDRLRVDAPPDAQLTDPALEASIGAVWGILDHCVAEGKARRAQQILPMLAYLVLSPAIGAERAVDTISRTETFTNQ